MIVQMDTYTYPLGKTSTENDGRKTFIYNEIKTTSGRRILGLSRRFLLNFFWMSDIDGKTTS